MGADACHHNGCIRPSKYLPIPSSIAPNPLTKTSTTPCLGAVFEDLQTRRGRDKTQSFFDVPREPAGLIAFFDVDEAISTQVKVQDADSQENVFVVMAHDESLMNIVDFFPKEANDWKAKGWGKDGKWAFLQDFQGAIN
jgi:hypothetical protein